MIKVIYVRAVMLYLNQEFKTLTSLLIMLAYNPALLCAESSTCQGQCCQEEQQVSQVCKEGVILSPV